MTSLVRLSRQTPIILVIDDDALTRAMMSYYLEQDSYVVVTAATGEDGLALYKQLQPDIVLLDVVLPDIHGFDCCRQIATTPGSAHIPILMITGLDDQDTIDQAFETGAADYIPKPIHWTVLRHRLKRFLMSSRAMMQLEFANLELERIAAQDGLTFVANRRCFDVALAKEWRRMLREQKPLSLILCDIDFFKVYNDTYGHQSGDRCLKKVANILASAGRRPSDLVARYGGEEFAILLPNTPLEGAFQISSTIRKKLQTAQIEHSTSPVSKFVTVSMGIVSQIPEVEHGHDVLIDRADKALYKAKAEGRDRIEMFDSVAIPLI